MLRSWLCLLNQRAQVRRVTSLRVSSWTILSIWGDWRIIWPDLSWWYYVEVLHVSFWLSGIILDPFSETPQILVVVLVNMRVGQLVNFSVEVSIDFEELRELLMVKVRFMRLVFKYHSLGRHCKIWIIGTPTNLAEIVCNSKTNRIRFSMRVFVVGAVSCAFCRWVYLEWRGINKLQL